MVSEQNHLKHQGFLIPPNPENPGKTAKNSQNTKEFQIPWWEQIEKHQGKEDRGFDLCFLCWSLNSVRLSKQQNRTRTSSSSTFLRTHSDPCSDKEIPFGRALRQLPCEQLSWAPKQEPTKAWHFRGARTPPHLSGVPGAKSE